MKPVDKHGWNRGRPKGIRCETLYKLRQVYEKKGVIALADIMNKHRVPANRQSEVIDYLLKLEFYALL